MTRQAYSKVEPQMERLCKQHSAALVSTFFDLYALPTDFPGKNSLGYPTTATGRQKAQFLDSALAPDIGRRNFIPSLLVHELVALLFVGVDAFADRVGDDRVPEPLHAVGATTGPEDINDSPPTAPSKRMLAAMPRYKKTLHGPLIACDMGGAMTAGCPHFAQWLNRIELLI